MVQSHHSGATKCTILVVDDSTTMRSMVQSFLSQDEFHVQVAKSGQECLARIHEHCPDILLLDFIIPGMNGYEVYTRLRQQPEYVDLPIVIMSGSQVEVFNKFAESKVEQKFVFLSKPFDPETLKRQIALALELRLIPKTVEEIVVREAVPLEETSIPNLPVEAVLKDITAQSTPVLEPVEKTLTAHLEGEETAAISTPQVPTEDESLDYIQQNLAHILKTETYVMDALRNLDERSAEDMRSIKNLADHTTLLQQELMHVRGVLNNLNELPKQLETLKEQVLSQPQLSQAYPDETEQEHVRMGGDHLKNVDSALMQSVVMQDLLERGQAGLGETVHLSSGQLPDRRTAIERYFEAIIVRPANPVPVGSFSKSYMPLLLYVTLFLGVLNLGAMVTLLLR